eukprot:5436739-Alexandrium_andersonii.AAC.1
MNWVSWAGRGGRHSANGSPPPPAREAAGCLGTRLRTLVVGHPASAVSIGTPRAPSCTTEVGRMGSGYFPHASARRGSA